MTLLIYLHGDKISLKFYNISSINKNPTVQQSHSNIMFTILHLWIVLFLYSKTLCSTTAH